MRKCCKTYCCCFMCCKCCKKTDYINEIDNTTCLLPEINKNKLSGDESKFVVFGKIFAEFNKEIIELQKINKNIVIKRIAIGKEHLLILFNDGNLYGIGKNNFGQLGKPLNKDNTLFKDFVRIEASKSVVSDLKCSDYQVSDIACGDNFSIILIRANNTTRLLRFGINEEDKYKDDFDKIKTIVSS